MQAFPTRTQEQGKPLSPITEKVARPDPSSVSAGRVRENSWETVLSKEGKRQKFTHWKNYHTQLRHPKAAYMRLSAKLSHRSWDPKIYASYRKCCQAEDRYEETTVVVLPGKDSTTGACSWTNSPHLSIPAVAPSLPSWQQSVNYVPYLQHRERCFGSSLAVCLLAASGERIAQKEKAGKEVSMPLLTCLFPRKI